MDPSTVRTYQGRRWLEQLGRVAGSGGAERWRTLAVLGVSRPSSASESGSGSAARATTIRDRSDADPQGVAGWAVATVVA